MAKHPAVTNKFDEFFDMIDHNKNGLIEKDEIQNMIELVYQSFKQMRMQPIEMIIDKVWSIFDKENRGYLNKTFV